MMTSQSLLRDLEAEWGKINKSLPKLVKKKGQIKIPDAQFTGLRNAIRKYRKATGVIPPEYVVDLVLLLDTSNNDICNRLSEKPFLLFVELILNSEYCLECERGIYLLAKSIFHDGTKAPKEASPRKTTIGEDCIYSLLNFFSNLSNREGLRQWVGILLQQLLSECDENLERLKGRNGEALRSLGQILLEDTNDINKTVCAEIIRIVAAYKVPLEDMWPLGTADRVFQDFPIRSRAEGNNWHRQLVIYLNDLTEADTQTFNIPDSNGCFYFPSGLETIPTSEFEGFNHHYIYFWITRDSISVLTPISADRFYTRLEISRDLITEMTLDDKTCLLSQTAENFQDLVMKLDVDADQPSLTCTINSKPVVLETVRAAFRSDMITEVLEDIGRMDFPASQDNTSDELADQTPKVQHGSISIEHIDTALEGSVQARDDHVKERNLPRSDEPEKPPTNSQDSTQVEPLRLVPAQPSQTVTPEHHSETADEANQPDQLRGISQSPLKETKSTLEPSRTATSKHKVQSDAVKVLKQPFIMPSQRAPKKALQAETGPPSKGTDDGKDTEMPLVKTSSTSTPKDTNLQDTRQPEPSSDVEQDYDASTPLKLPIEQPKPPKTRPQMLRNSQLPDTQRVTVPLRAGAEDDIVSAQHDLTSPLPESDDSERSPTTPSALENAQVTPAYAKAKHVIEQPVFHQEGMPKIHSSSRVSKDTRGHLKGIPKSQGISGTYAQTNLQNSDGNPSDDKNSPGVEQAIEPPARIENPKNFAPLKAKKPLKYGKGSANQPATQQPVGDTPSIWDIPKDDTEPETNNKKKTKQKGNNRKNPALKETKPKTKKIQAVSQPSQGPQRSSRRQADLKAKMNLHEDLNEDDQDDDEYAVSPTNRADADDMSMVTNTPTTIQVPSHDTGKNQKDSIVESKISDSIENDAVKLQPEFKIPAIPIRKGFNKQQVAVDEAQKLYRILDDGMAISGLQSSGNLGQSHEGRLLSESHRQDQLSRLELDSNLASESDDEDDFAFGTKKSARTLAQSEEPKLSNSAPPSNEETQIRRSENSSAVAHPQVPARTSAKLPILAAEKELATTEIEVELEQEEFPVPVTASDSQVVTETATMAAPPKSCKNVTAQQTVNTSTAAPLVMYSAHTVDESTDITGISTSPATTVFTGERQKRRPQEESTAPQKRQRQDIQHEQSFAQISYQEEKVCTPSVQHPLNFMQQQQAQKPTVLCSPQRSSRPVNGEAPVAALPQNLKDTPLLVDDNLSRKPTIIKFSQNGPSNQGKLKQHHDPADQKSQSYSTIPKSTSVETKSNEIPPRNYYDSEADSPGPIDVLEDKPSDNKTRLQVPKAVTIDRKILAEQMSVNEIVLIENISGKDDREDKMIKAMPDPLQPRKRQINKSGGDEHVGGSDRPRKRQSISPQDRPNEENELPQDQTRSPVPATKAVSRQTTKLSLSNFQGPVTESQAQQRQQLSRFSSRETRTPLYNAQRPTRSLQKGSSQISRVTEQGSPIGNSHLPIQLKKDKAVELFGPAVAVSASKKARPSSPESVQVKYIPHTRNQHTGRYENLNSEEVISPEKPLPDPFDKNLDVRSSKFTELLQGKVSPRREDVVSKALSDFFANHDEDNEPACDLLSNELGGDTLVNLEPDLANQTSPNTDLSSRSTNISNQENLSSPSAENDPNEDWKLAVRPHYRGLATAVHRVADEVLIKLADKETAVETIVKQYETSAKGLVDEFQLRRTTEQRQMLQDLNQKKENMIGLYREAREAAASIQTEVGGSQVKPFEQGWQKRHDNVQRELDDARHGLLNS
ncbi:hypothetical protein PVAG01_10942 [Phlyctema vagabunda]|uniref:Uncharacterized protein n=1 Tax=Phlyctema vagabunda TaxID=108571 RepID=A0ABR4P3N8_9HELO